MLVCPKCKAKIIRSDAVCKNCGEIVSVHDSIKWIPYNIPESELEKIVVLSKQNENIPFALWFDPITCTLHLDSDAPEGSVWIYDVDQEETPEIISSIVNEIMKDVDYGIF